MKKKFAAQRRIPHHTKNWPVQNLKMQYVLRSLKMHIDVPVETLTTRKKKKQQTLYFTTKR